MSDLKPPEWTTDLRRRLAPLQLGPARETEIIEELSQHLDQRYEELRATGVSEPEATRLVAEELLEPEALARFMRPLRQANLPAPIVLGAPRRSWREASGAGSALRRTDAVAAAQLRRGGHPDAGARHRRQRRDLRAGGRGVAAPAAVPEPGGPAAAGLPSTRTYCCLPPRVALLSHSSFGSSRDACAQVMRDALALIEARAPDLEVEGEMQGDAALSKRVLDGQFTGSRLTADANLLIMPNVDAANIAYNLLKMAAGDGITVGPILLGAARPVHIIEPTASVRRIVNMTALAVVDAAVEGGRRAAS